MTGDLQASSVFEIPADPKLIPIFPAGTTRGFDGRGPYHLKNPAAVIAASKRQHVDAMIDRDHQVDLLPPGSPVKAAGWIKEFVVQDGGIYGRVEWTPAAEQELKDKEFRYISPVFRHDKEGNVLSIVRASLTNHPNFDMKAVASARQTTETETPEKENDTMSLSKTLLATAAVLSLASTASEEDILAKATEVANELASTKQSLQELLSSQKAVATALGLKGDEKADVMVSTASTLKATKTDKADPDKFVPMETFQATAAELKTIQDERKAEKAETAVAAAMKDGKIIPANKDWAMEYASSNPDGFKKFIEAAPVIVAGGEMNTEGKKVTASDKMDEGDLAVASMLGVSEDSYKKARAE